MRVLALGFVTAFIAVTPAVAADVVWSGSAGDGDWHNAENWIGGNLPTETDRVVFRNAEPVSVIMTNAVSVDAISVEGTDVVFGNNKLVRIGGNSGGTGTVHVVAGATLVSSNIVYGNKAPVLCKTGGGEMRLVGTSGTYCRLENYSLLEVKEGSWNFTTPNSHGVYCYVQDVKIRKGASLMISGYNSTNSKNIVFDVEEGAYLYFNISSGETNVAGITGGGTVDVGPCGRGVVTLTFARGPFRFDGTFKSPLEIKVTPAKDVLPEDCVITVGATNTLAEVGVIPAGMLRFAAGAGERFFVKRASGGTLDLEDTEGNPITVDVGSSSFGNMIFTGAGNLNVSGWAMVLTNGQLRSTGSLAMVTGHNMQFGDGTAGNDVDLTGISSFSSLYSGQVVFSNASPQSVPCPYRASGWTKLYGPVEFGDFRYASNIEVGGDLTLSGGESVISDIGFIGDGVHTLSVKGGRHGYSRAVGAYESWSVLPVPGFINVYNNDKWGIGRLAVSGGEIYIRAGYNSSSDYGSFSSIALTGGRTYFSNMGFKDPLAATAENPMAILIDGGVFGASCRDAPYTWNFCASGYGGRSRFEIGAKGARFEARHVDRTDTSQVFFDLPAKSRAGVADGGVEVNRDGHNHMFKFGPMDISGPFTMHDGQLLFDPAVVAGTPACFGSGDFNLDCASLDGIDSADGPATLKLATGAGSVFKFAGSSTIRFRKSSEIPAQHVVAGADNAASSALASAGKGAALFLFDGGLSLSGDGSTFKVNGGVATNADGLVILPVFGARVQSLDFLSYDDEKGFVAFTGHVDGFPTDGRGVFKVGATGFLGENMTAHAAAVATKEWSVLDLRTGSRLKIGDGVNPAPLLINYCSGVDGSGTLDFGSSEGLIVVGRHQSGDRGHVLGCRIEGSGGVSYVAHPNLYHRIRLTGTGAYTGGTFVSGAALLVQNEEAFAAGPVRVLGGYRNGGKIVFETDDMTFHNDWHVSGSGHWTQTADSNGQGALSFWAVGTTLAGSVELTGKTCISSVPEGASGTFGGVVSGDVLERACRRGTDRSRERQHVYGRNDDRERHARREEGSFTRHGMRYA